MQRKEKYQVYTTVITVTTRLSEMTILNGMSSRFMKRRKTISVIGVTTNPSYGCEKPRSEHFV